MKQVLAATLLLAAGLSGNAQPKQGKVIYEQKLDLSHGPNGEYVPEMAGKFYTFRYELDFLGSESLYRKMAEDEDVRDKAGEDQDGPKIRLDIKGSNDVVYRNYTTQKTILQRELGPRKYIIDDSLSHQDWKLTGESRVIKGYNCKKATTTDMHGGPVVAWYSEDLAVPAGPGNFGGLPGLILELNFGDGKVVFYAQEINTGVADGSVVKAPTDGKHISRKELDKMMDDEMGPANSGPRMRIIRN